MSKKKCKDQRAITEKSRATKERNRRKREIADQVHAVIMRADNFNIHFEQTPAECFPENGFRNFTTNGTTIITVETYEAAKDHRIRDRVQA